MNLPTERKHMIMENQRIPEAKGLLDEVDIMRNETVLIEIGDQRIRIEIQVEVGGSELLVLDM